MSYRQKKLWDKRLPAFSGIFILLFALSITIFLSSNTVLFVTRATIGSTPKNIQISNISNDSFTISYLTDETTTGALAYGAEPALGTVSLDDRDVELGKPAEHRVHYITITDLAPATKYYFAISSGSITATNNGVPYEVTTAPPDIDQPAEKPPFTGSAALDDGKLPVEAIVSVASKDSQLITSLLKPDGSYTVPLTKLRKLDLSTYFTFAPDEKVTIKVITPTLASEATVLGQQTAEIPRIVLSKNYDFTISTDALTDQTASTSGTPASQSGFPTFEDPIVVTSPDITVPKEEQQFKDTQPLFKGVALPNAEIEIVINSAKEITAKLQSNSDGRWEFRPPISLEAGTHTLSIASMDISGTLTKITRSFTVSAAGSQFVEPSVSPVDGTGAPIDATTITPTVVSLPTPTVTPTPSPTLVATPSATMTPQPTTSGTPTRGPLSPTGNGFVATGIFGTILALGIGAVLLVLTVI